MRAAEGKAEGGLQDASEEERKREEGYGRVGKPGVGRNAGVGSRRGGRRWLPASRLLASNIPCGVLQG